MNHWYVSGAVPVATTLKLAVEPVPAVTATGCVVITGALPGGGATVSVAGDDVT